MEEKAPGEDDRAVDAERAAQIVDQLRQRVGSLADDVPRGDIIFVGIEDRGRHGSPLHRLSHRVEAGGQIARVLGLACREQGIAEGAEGTPSIGSPRR